MAMVTLEWHSLAVSESLWFVRSDHRVILVTAGKDGFICIGTMVSDKIKFTQRIYRYVKCGLNEKNVYYYIVYPLKLE